MNNDPPRGRGLGSREVTADLVRRNDDRLDDTGDKVKPSVATKPGLVGGDSIMGILDRLSEL